MPIRLKSGKVGYLIEYREGHPCPYKVGIGANTTMYLSADSIVEDPDRWPEPKKDSPKPSPKKATNFFGFGGKQT